MLTDTQISKIRLTFANGSLANIKFSKTQFSKMILSRGSVGMFDPIKILFKIANKVEDLYKKVTLIDIIKTGDAS